MGLLNLTSLTLFSTVALVGLVLVAYTTIKTYTSYRKLRHFPGPWHAAWSSSWLLYHTVRSDLYLTIDKTMKQYGSLARMAPHLIVTNDPDLYRIMTASRSSFVRGPWYRCLKLDPRLDNVASMRDEKEHADRRTRLIPGYTGKDVPTLERDIDGQVMNLVKLIRRDYIDKNEKFDFAILSGYFTLDSLTQIAYNNCAGFLDKNEDLFDYFKTSEKFFPIMELGGNNSTIMDVLHSKPMLALAGPKPGSQVGLGAIINEAYNQVAKRYEPDAKLEHDSTMIGSFVRHGLTREQVESEATVQILAGSDSTATAIRITLVHILGNPRVYTRLVNEIIKAVESGDISYPVIRQSEAQKLPYLQSCIKEGLRIFMPLNGLASKQCPPEGYTHNGYFIPGGTEIGFSTYSMQRREDIYGADAAEFRPERWIDGNPEAIEEMEKIRQLTFGYGRVLCLGKDVAYMELSKVIFELLRSYDMWIVDPLAGVTTWCNGVTTQVGMFMRALPRNIEV